MSRAREALGRLRAAARDGSLAELAGRHHIRILGVFGSTLDPDRSEPHDLDIVVGFERDTDYDLIALMNDLMDLTRFDFIDLMNLNRGFEKPVARTSGLVGEPLYESEPGACAAAQLHSIHERMDTTWLRRLELELLAS